MKIAMIAAITAVTPPRKTGPQQQLVSLLTEALVQRGHDVTLYASGDSSTRAELKSISPRALSELTLDHTIRMGLGPSTQAGLLGLGRLANQEHVAWAIRDADASDADLIHCHDTLGLMMARGLKKPMVHTLHGGFPCPAQDVASFLKVLSGYFGGFPGVDLVCVSESQRAVYPPELPIRVIYNALDYAQFPIGTGARDYLLYLGRMTASKGAHMAITVALTAGLPIRLAGPIQGSMGDPDYFERHIRPRVDGDRVQYVGEVGPAQRLALYQGAKALLVPLQWPEPFGLTLIEGMACGTPVIAFPKGSPEELIEDGVSGFLAQNSREMVERIGDVTRLEPEKVRAHVTACFSVDRMVDGYVAAYEGALARSSSQEARS